jgi:hypothetical protein
MMPAASSSTQITGGQTSGGSFIWFLISPTRWQTSCRIIGSSSQPVLTSSGKNYVWDVQGISTDPGVRVQLYEWNQGVNQLFLVENVPAVQNTCKINRAEGGLALENWNFQWNFDNATIPQNVATDQTNAIQTNPNGFGLNQVWILDEDNGSGEFRIRSLTNNLVWAIARDKIGQNANLFLDRDDGSNRHRWIFNDLGGGRFRISCTANTGFALDMPDGLNDIGLDVQQFSPAHGGPNQQWSVESFGY